MKRGWIVDGLVIVVGVYVLITNDTKSGIDSTARREAWVHGFSTE